MEEKQNLLFQQGNIAHQRVVEESGLLFPMVLLPPCGGECSNIQSFLQDLRDNRGWIEDQLEDVGAILFRGFPVTTASDFNAVVEAFGWEEQQYRGEATRKNVHGRVYTANESALDRPINFHHEMSKFEDFPTKLFFFCEVAPPEGGQTAILLSYKITQRMEEKYPELVKKLEREGLFTSSIYYQEDNPDNFLKGWQTLFQTKDKQEAEMAAKSGAKSKVCWEGSKMIIQRGPLVSVRTFDGKRKKRQAWFNHLALWGLYSTQIMGDGSVFPLDAIEHCIHLMEEESVDVKWEVGDVLLIDNRLVQHARRPSKPPRKVLVSMCK